MLWVTDSRIRGRYDHTILVEMTSPTKGARIGFIVTALEPRPIYSVVSCATKAPTVKRALRADC
jgi:hypothetical protein